MYQEPTLLQILLIALVGIIVVFVVLVILMGIIRMMSEAVKLRKEPVTEAPAKAPVAPAASAPVPTQTKTVGVSEREAAMIMAIVADELQKPLETLQFISIKEVTK